MAPRGARPQRHQAPSPGSESSTEPLLLPPSPGPGQEPLGRWAWCLEASAGSRRPASTALDHTEQKDFTPRGSITELPCSVCSIGQMDKRPAGRVVPRMLPMETGALRRLSAWETPVPGRAVRELPRDSRKSSRAKMTRNCLRFQMRGAWEESGTLPGDPRFREGL